MVLEGDADPAAEDDAPARLEGVLFGLEFLAPFPVAVLGALGVEVEFPLVEADRLGHGLGAGKWAKKTAVPSLAL